MIPQASQGTQSQASGVMSLESVFIQHYMNAMTALQNCWLYSESDDGIDVNKFNIQLEYLIRLIPDADTQKKIRKEQDAAIKSFTENNLDHPLERAGLVVVTHLIEFICSSFDMIHIDIVGPATSKQYRDAILEIPDMPPELVRTPEPTTPLLDSSPVVEQHQAIDDMVVV
jgi:hypothetical protein